MEFTARQIADIIGGEIKGDPAIKISKLSKIEEGVPNSISFLANPAYTNYLYETNASVVIIAKTFVPDRPVKKTCTLILVDNPRESFAKLLEAYNQIKLNKTGIEQPSHISTSAKVGTNVYIGAFAYIGENVIIGNNVKLFPNVFVGDNTVIGDNTVVYAGVKIYSETVIGKHCLIHSGAVIGSDGFGFEANKESKFTKVPQIGNVVIEDNVEVGSNTSIDRATLGSTILRRGVKLDNLIQIAHNVEIGEDTVIAGQTGVAGSTKVGKNCMIGAQVGIAGHITIANGVKIAGQTGIGSSITKEGEIVQGSPAMPIGDFRRSYVVFKNLPDLQNKIKQLEKILEELKQSVPR